MTTKLLSEAFLIRNLFFINRFLSSIPQFSASKSKETFSQYLMGISIKKVLSRAFYELDLYKILSALINPSCPIMPIQNYSYFSIKKNLGHFSLVITTSDDALLLGFSSVVVGLQSSRGCRHRGREEDEKKKKREKLRLKTAALVVNSEGSGIC